MASGLHPTPHRARADHAATIPAQQPRRRSKRHTDRKRTAQKLAFPAGLLLRLHPQGLLQGRHLGAGTSVRTPSDAAAPAERPDQARQRARGKTLTAQRRSPGRPRGPGDRPLGTFGEDICDDVLGQDPREGPHGQDQLRARVRVVDRVEPLWHGGIIMTYAVVKA